MTTGARERAVADVSAVADPNTGVAVYDSYAYQGARGWMVFGGTSVSSPVIASVYALAGNAGAATTLPATPTPRAVRRDERQQRLVHAKQLCTAGTGWDGPTGLGTPNGTSAF